MKDTIARILAAANILSNADDEVISKLANLIGDDVAKLVPHLIEETLSDELFNLIVKHMELLDQEIPETQKQEPSRILMVN